MKALMLLRHGKSDWNAAYQTDFERPLAGRGKRAARLIGRFVSSFSCEPDLIVTSSALRADRTVRLAAEAGKWQCPIVSNRNLYEATAGLALHLVQSQDDRVERLMLVGHNPTWEDLAGIFSGGSRFRIPTCGLVHIQFGVANWRGISPGSGTVTWFVTPKLLKKVPH